MKKILMTLIFILFLIPTVVLAEDKVEIKSITFVEKSENTKINTEASTDGEKINLDLVFYDKDDYATYKVVVKNTTNTKLFINDDYFNKDNKHISYDFLYNDGDNIVKPGEEKEFNIKISYKKEIPKDDFKSGKYDLSTNNPLILSDKLIKIPNTLKNLGILGICISIILILCIFTGLFIITKKNKKTSINIILLLLLLIVIPHSADALLRIDIPIDSKIIVKLVKPTYCTYDGDMVKGTHYDHGQFTYTYLQYHDYGTVYNDFSVYGYDNLDGWSVELTDKDSTDPVDGELCTYINDKPIVFMTNMLSNSKASKYDFSKWDTSNVLVMSGLLNGAAVDADSVELIDIEYLDTSNVTSFYSMFQSFASNSELIELNLDLTRWDTSNLIYMSGMFRTLGNNSKSVVVDVHNWKLPKLTDISYAFTTGCNSKYVEIKSSGLDMPVITSIYSVFSSTGTNADYLKIDVTDWKFDSLTKLESVFFTTGSGAKDGEIIGLDTWKLDNITSTNYMFAFCFNNSTNTEINWDLSSWNMSKVEDARSMFRMFGNRTKKVNLNLEGWKFKNGCLINSMFAYTFDSTEELTINMHGWDVTGTTNYLSIFEASSKNSNMKAIIDMSDWKTTGLNNLDYTFAYMCFTHAKSLTIDVSNWDTSQVTSMKRVFYTIGNDIEGDNFHIIGLDTWDTSNVTDMSEMFYCIYNLDVSGLKIYAANTSSMFLSSKVYGTITIYNNPTSYTNMFTGTNMDTSSNALTVNYTSAVTDIDNIMSTRSNPVVKVYKGELIEG